MSTAMTSNRFSLNDLAASQDLRLLCLAARDRARDGIAMDDARAVLPVMKPGERIDLLRAAERAGWLMRVSRMRIHPAGDVTSETRWFATEAQP